MRRVFEKFTAKHLLMLLDSQYPYQNRSFARIQTAFGHSAVSRLQPLIELLIVVVIIGIIAAIAVPNLLASRRSANGASAVEAMRLFHSVQAT